MSGLAEYFFRLFVRPEFLARYDTVRIKHVKETQDFYYKLTTLKGIKVYPTKSNFCLIELLDNKSSSEICLKLLVRYGIYARSCDDKRGLSGNFIRVASRTKEENAQIIQALKEVIAE